MSDEELTIDCCKEVPLGIFDAVGLAGTLSLLVLLILAVDASIIFPGVPRFGFPLWTLCPLVYGTSLAVVLLKYRRFSKVQLRFNKTYMRAFDAGVLRQEILWVDVQGIRTTLDTRLQTDNGISIVVPRGVMRSHRHECRLLRRQIQSLIEPPATRPSVPKIILGMTLFVLGCASVFAFKHANVEREGAVALQSLNWVYIWALVLGLPCAVVGFLIAASGADRLMKAPKRHRFMISDDGIAFGRRRIRWDHVQQLDQFGLEDHVLRLRLDDGKSLTVNCKKSLDGSELRDGILGALSDRFGESGSGALLHPRRQLTVRTSNNSWPLILILTGYSLAGLVAMIIVLMGRVHFKDMASEVFFVGVVLAWWILYGFAVTDLISQIELGKDVLSRRNLRGKLTKIRLTDVESVTIRHLRSTQDAVDSMIVRSGDSVIVLNSHIDKYCELRDAVLAAVPESIVRAS